MRRVLVELHRRLLDRDIADRVGGDQLDRIVARLERDGFVEAAVAEGNLTAVQRQLGVGLGAARDAQQRSASNENTRTEAKTSQCPPYRSPVSVS